MRLRKRRESKPAIRKKPGYHGSQGRQLFKKIVPYTSVKLRKILNVFRNLITRNRCGGDKNNEVSET